MTIIIIIMILGVVAVHHVQEEFDGGVDRAVGTGARLDSDLEAAHSQLLRRRGIRVKPHAFSLVMLIFAPDREALARRFEAEGDAIAAVLSGVLC